MRRLLLLMLLLGLCGFGRISELSLVIVDPWCFYLLAVLGVVSGADYIRTWGRKAWRHGRNRSTGGSRGA